MNMQTISLFEEGNGVHIVIPNTKIEEIKNLMAALLINNVAFSYCFCEIKSFKLNIFKYFVFSSKLINNDIILLS